MLQRSCHPASCGARPARRERTHHHRVGATAAVLLRIGRHSPRIGNSRAGRFGWTAELGVLLDVAQRLAHDHRRTVTAQRRCSGAHPSEGERHTEMHLHLRAPIAGCRHEVHAAALARSASPVVRHPSNLPGTSFTILGSPLRERRPVAFAGRTCHSDRSGPTVVTVTRPRVAAPSEDNVRQNPYTASTGRAMVMCSCTSSPRPPDSSSCVLIRPASDQKGGVPVAARAITAPARSAAGTRQAEFFVASSNPTPASPVATLAVAGVRTRLLPWAPRITKRSTCAIAVSVIACSSSAPCVWTCALEDPIACCVPATVRMGSGVPPPCAAHEPVRAECGHGARKSRQRIAMMEVRDRQDRVA